MEALRQYAQQFALETKLFTSDMSGALQSRLDAIRVAASILPTEYGADAPPVLRAMFDKLQSTYPEFEWIGLANAKGKVLAANAGLAEGSNVAGHAWFLQGTKGPWIGTVEISILPQKTPHELSYDRPHQFVDMSAPVLDSKGRVVGIVAAHLSWRWAKVYTQRLTRALNQKEPFSVLILNQDRLVLTGPASYKGKHWSGVPVKHKLLNDENSDFLKNGIPGLQSRFERLPDGQEVLTAQADISSKVLSKLGWRVQLFEPVQQAYQQANALWVHILWVSLSTGVLLALLGAYISRRITSRMTLLSNSIKNLNAGNVTRLVEIKGMDEVAKLRAAFAKQLDDLNHERNELRNFSSGLEQLVTARTREVERLSENKAYTAATHERLRIARELHDTLANSMMAMLAQIRLLRNLHIHDPAALGAELVHAEEVAHSGLREARDAINQLRFNPVRDVGLGMALTSATKDYSDRTGQVVELISDRESESLSDRRAELVFNITLEALRNMEHHAKASHVKIELRVTDGRFLEFSIRDNGMGFDPSRSFPGHYGLVGMHEQAEQIGATLTIKSTPGKGTSLELRLDLQG